MSQERKRYIQTAPKQRKTLVVPEEETIERAKEDETPGKTRFRKSKTRRSKRAFACSIQRREAEAETRTAFGGVTPRSFAASTCGGTATQPSRSVAGGEEGRAHAQAHSLGEARIL